MSQLGVDGKAASKSARVTALRGLTSAVDSKRRLAYFAILLLLTVALCYTPVGRIVLTVHAASIGNVDIQINFAIAIAVVGAMILGLGYGTALGVGLGIAHMIRCQTLPMTAYDTYFQAPLTAIVPIAVCLIFAALLFALLRPLLFSDKRGVRVLVIIGACLLISFFYSSFQYYILAIANSAIVTGAPEESTLRSLLRSDRVIEFVVNGLILIIACLLTSLAEWRNRKGLWNRSMRGVFRRYVMLFMTVAFIVALAITFCYETVRAVEVAGETLTGDAVYLDRQIDDHLAKAAQLTTLEDNAILDKAHTAATLIARNPSILSSVETLSALKSTLNLASLTVADASGTVIADADGIGVGVYDFGAHEQTSRYLALVSGQVADVVEQPRVSLDADGNATDAYALFAGIPRDDASGFIQVSIAASDYEAALSSASIENLGNSYHIGRDGGMIVARGDTVVTATETSQVGTALSEGMDATDEDFANNLMAVASLVDDDGYRSFSLVRLDSYGEFRTVCYLPMTEVFEERDSIMLWNTFFYLVLFGVVSLVAAGLLSNVVVKGIDRTNSVLGKITKGDLGQVVDVRSNTEFESLSDGINTTVDALKESIAEANARIDRELATARAIQGSALPQTFPPFPEISDFDIYASMNPAREVGGDFYDFFLIDEHRLGFLIADVSGKGIPAALFMMTAKTDIENYMSTGGDLAQAISTVNHHLCEGNEAEMFVTAFLAVLDYTTGELTYVNAGHNPPLLRHNGQWEWVRDKSGLFLGGMDGIQYKSFTRTLAFGDQLLLYTDGVTEAWSAADEIYGEDRLQEVLQQNANFHPTALVRKMENNLARFAEGRDQADDITMLALEYGEAPDVSGSITVDATVDNMTTVLDFVHEELAKRLCPIKAQKQLDIALEELYVNIAHYAYPDAPADKPGKAKVSYTYNATPPCITVELADSGVPYDPLKKPDPNRPDSVEDAPIGGLGILMAKKSVDDIDYRYERGHNIVTFLKRW